MKLSCRNYVYNEKWDNKLNRLITEGVVVETCKHTIKFSLVKSVTTVSSWVFWTKEVTNYDYYRVWTSNEDSAYGYLYTFNGFDIPKYLTYSADKDTLKKLFVLETSIRNPLIHKAYE